MSVAGLAPYVPMERRQALATGRSLPEQRYGAAVFADISGFTPLTEALARELGPQHGAEELTRHLDRVYDVLIDELHRFGGSVVGFSGDAVTCWLDGDNGARAVACGLAMQTAMAGLGPAQTPSGRILTLAVKVAVAAGPARHYVVGQAEVQLIGVLAGATLERLAATEHQLLPGEVGVDRATAGALGDLLVVAEWRQAGDDPRSVAVVRGLAVPVMPTPWPALPARALDERALRPWLVPAVDARLRAGQGEFLAELRPAVALFLRFGGIDYEGDPAAGEHLDAYVRWVQAVLARYGGALIQLTIGDKGSYLYAAFGAPQAHEDDAARAAAAALDLRQAPAPLAAIGPVQIGVSQGRMRTGAYGAHSQRTYGVLGDDVNVAARLMQAAAPGEVLVSQRAQESAGPDFEWQALPPLSVKGKSEPLTVYRLRGAAAARRARLREPRYALPMIGRQEELALAEARLGQAVAGRGQIVAVVGEAGMGKSRLMAEIVRLAHDRGLASFGGECSSYGLNTPYLVWQSVWRGLFKLDPAAPVAAQAKALARALRRVDSDPSTAHGARLAPRFPLLGTVVNLPIPDNDLTTALDAKLRKTSLESLLVDCLRAMARRPLLLVLEDCHWMDPLSHDLLETLGRAIANLPVCIALSHRPPQEGLPAPRVGLLPHCTAIALRDFAPEEAARLIRLKLEQLFGPHAGVPPELAVRITERAQGNPFYIEELLNYLHGQGVDPHDRAAIARLDLPASLHSLILTRVDQLSERQRATLKVASVVGRLFRASLLAGAYPALGSIEDLKEDLAALTRLDLTTLDAPEPDLTYLFKHVVTQEAVYESLPFATRSHLHEEVAHFVEDTADPALGSQLDLLAFHYGRSENTPKKREYLLKAGEAAQSAYANDSAIAYYRRALELLTGEEAVAARLRLGQVLELVGLWDETQALYDQALAEAEALGDRAALARCQTAIGELRGKRGAYREAASWLAHARAGFEALGAETGLGQVLHLTGTLAAQQGDYATARARYRESLAIRRRLDDRPRVAALLSNLGIIARFEGDTAAARAQHEEALAIRRELEDRGAIANSLNNLGNVALDTGDHATARTCLEEAVTLLREVGDRWGIANALNNLGNVASAQGDYGAARALYAESVPINRELGDRSALAYLLEDIGSLLARESQPAEALRLVGAAAGLREAIGAPLSASEQVRLDQALAAAREQLGPTAETVLASGRAAPLDDLLDALIHRLQPAPAG